MEEPNLNGQYSTFFGGFAKIYTLTDKDGNLFYVGCTIVDLETRLKGHISLAMSYGWGNDDEYISKKCAVIKKSNFQITATVVDMVWVTGRNSKSAITKTRVLELSWIKKLLGEGHPITNVQKQIEPRPRRRQYTGKTIVSPAYNGNVIIV